MATVKELRARVEIVERDLVDARKTLQEDAVRVKRLDEALARFTAPPPPPPPAVIPSRVPSLNTMISIALASVGIVLAILHWLHYLPNRTI